MGTHCCGDGETLYYYLFGTLFVIRIDHAAFQWLMYFREPEGQVPRWLEEPQAFNYTVEHRAATQHSNADALSHRPCAAEGCLYCEKQEEKERELTATDSTAHLSSLMQVAPGGRHSRVEGTAGARP